MQCLWKRVEEESAFDDFDKFLNRLPRYYAYFTGAATRPSVREGDGSTNFPVIGFFPIQTPIICQFVESVLSSTDSFHLYFDHGSILTNPSPGPYV